MNNNANELLRAAHGIAKRKGEDVNWEAFEASLRKELLTQMGLDDNTEDEQLILRSTCTARVYRSIEQSSTLPWHKLMAILGVIFLAIILTAFFK